MSKILSLLLAILLTTSASAAGQCTWVKLGYDKSHYDNGSWCKDGWFLTQLDLDGGKSGENYPIVGKARCCKANIASVSSYDGKADSPTLSDVSTLQEQINYLSNELEILRRRLDDIAPQ